MKHVKRCLLLAMLALAPACGASTAAPPTATPRPAATHTHTPAPTARPPTATPTATDVPAPTLTPTATADPRQSACDHTYWPLRTGASWEYTDGSANWTQEVTAVSGDAGQATATLVTRYASGDSVTFTYECSADGLRLAGSTSAFGGVQSTSVFTTTRGVHLLGSKALVPGATWRLENEQAFSNSNGQSGLNQLVYDYAAQPLVTVETTAGAFLALPVEIVFSNLTTSPGQTLTTTHWYAAGVGLVYADIGGQTKWDLVSFTGP
jgi:hypothetical protein